MTNADDSLKKGVVLSGMRPTGSLHIGNIAGALNNWVKLQETHDCFYFVADHHATTTDLDTSDLGRRALDMVSDWLAYGLNPEKSVIFVQSYVHEHAELSLVLERMLNIGRARQMPTFRAQAEHIAGTKSVNLEKDAEGNYTTEALTELEKLANAELSFGFMGYPILQAADILLYDATHVPVGDDQDPHIELTRELARRFNKKYGDCLVVPETLHTESPRVLGSDGRKMSKSYGNELPAGENPEGIAAYVKGVTTVRPRLTDKGDPYTCPVFDLHRLYNDNAREMEVLQGCRNASFGCGDCKSDLPTKIADAFADFRTARDGITDNYVKDVLREGNRKAQEVAARTMDRVKSFMMMDYLKD